MSYKIVRNYFNGGNRVIARGLTLEEARAHCNNPETSSSTCTTPAAKAVTRRNGAWFDGYTEEPIRRSRRAADNRGGYRPWDEAIRQARTKESVE